MTNKERSINHVWAYSFRIIHVEPHASRRCCTNANREDTYILIPVCTKHCAGGRQNFTENEVEVLLDTVGNKRSRYCLVTLPVSSQRQRRTQAWRQVPHAGDAVSPVIRTTGVRKKTFDLQITTTNSITAHQCQICATGSSPGARSVPPLHGDITATIGKTSLIGHSRW